MGYYDGHDEDMIPCFKCDICHGQVCKGDVGSQTGEHECVCINCEVKE